VRVYRMPFGRHRGERLSQVPDGYLVWLADRPNLREPLRTYLEEELERRGEDKRKEYGSPASPFARPAEDAIFELISAGRRACAARHHSDRGGDGERLKALNAAADWLIDEIRKRVA
jgi:hypothetical protein